MDPQDILRANPLDILFENRNKAYGAYPLRKFYPQRLLFSFGLVFTLVIIGSFLYRYFRTFPLPVPAYTYKEIPINLIDPAVKIKPVAVHTRAAAVRAPAQIDHPVPLIVPDRDWIKPLATNKELEKNIMGLTTNAGPSDLGQTSGQGNAKAGVSLEAGDSAEGKPEVFRSAEVMPEFPGGMEALKRYLLRKLRMPDNNLEPGIRIQVVARFVVGADGRVRDIEITRAAAEDFNAEVKRVIAGMPDWKPGLQNHRAVAVYFNLPVNFENEP
jgi:periplasmic protein TonB